MTYDAKKQQQTKKLVNNIILGNWEINFKLVKKHHKHYYAIEKLRHKVKGENSPILRK